MKKEYKVKVVCQNCSFGDAYLSMDIGKVISIELGKKLTKTPCPKCMCKTLVKISDF